MNVLLKLNDPTIFLWFIQYVSGPYLYLFFVLSSFQFSGCYLLVKRFLHLVTKTYRLGGPLYPSRLVIYFHQLSYLRRRFDGSLFNVER